MAKRQISLRPEVEDALAVLGNQIRLARHDRRWTTADLAQRVGVSPRTIAAVEAGAPGTAIGTVFNAAAITGVPLFGVEDRFEMARLRRRGEEVIALLPSRVDRPRKDAGDFDF